MDKIKKILSYLDSKEIAELVGDLDFSNALKEAKDFFAKTSNDRILKVLSDEQKETYIKIAANIEDNFKSYAANRSSQYCLLINHYISDGYDLFFSEMKNFEQKFIDILNASNQNISKLDTDLNESSNKFKTAMSDLDEAKEKCKKTTTQVEDLITEATKRVNSFADKMNNENNSRIEAKRKQIDNELNIYRKGVEDTFNSKQKEVEETFKTWVNKFESLEESRQQFLEMYKIGIRYSGEARFDDYSLKEKKTADMFRWLSLSLMLLVVFAIGYLTYDSLKRTTTEEHPNIAISIFNILSRFLLVFSLMIPAVYASRESSRHRRNSDKYAQMANELKAFEIAIRTENMKEETRDRIKEEIFKRYFGNIFANTNVDRNISEDIIDIGRVIKTEAKD
jgi:exonuclease VII small subunit